MTQQERITAALQTIGEDIQKLIPIVIQVGGQFLFDPNEINGWGVIGMHDNSNTQDLGNVGTEINRLAGGISFPFDVELISFHAWHQNSNAAAQPWGWVISKQAKVDGSNGITNTYLVDESFDRGDGYFGLRDYGNNLTQRTDIVDIDAAIAADEVVNLAVGAPTAATTNYYARIMSGYMVFKRT